MGGDGAEGTTAKAPPVDIDTVLDHLVGRDALPLVFRMWLTGIGQVEGGIQFVRRHRRIGWVDDGVVSVDTLYQSLRMNHVRLLLDMSEVLRLFALVTQTLLMAMQHDVLLVDTPWDVLLVGKIDNLGQVMECLDGLSLAQSSCYI